MKPVLLITAVVAVLSCVVRPAWAACAKDIDCEGDRICTAGKCVSPPSAAPSPPAVTPARVAPPTPPARTSADRAACLDASTKGQTLRDGHKLVEAREQLRACAAARCPTVVQRDCASWLVEVEKALPSVVFTARDTAGADLSNVAVTVDGQPLVSSLDGQSVAVNPGPRAFHFQRADGVSVDRRVIVKEGEHSQAVAVVLPAAAAPPPTPPPAPPAAPAAEGTPSPAAPASAADAAASSSGSSGTLKIVGWVLGGVGIAGLGAGAIAGLVAMKDKNNAECNASGQCLPGPLSGARTGALVADVGFIAGGALLAAGAIIVLVAPRGGGTHASDAASVKVAPTFGSSGGGVVLGGSW